MPLIQFHIQYNTIYGQNIGIEYIITSGKKKTRNSLMLNTYDGSHWIGTIQIPSNAGIKYKYFCTDGIHRIDEPNRYRELSGFDDLKNVYAMDKWRDTDNNHNIFYSSAFTDIIFERKRQKKSPVKDVNTNYLRFNLTAPNIPSEFVVGVVGSHEKLGNWSTPVLLKYCAKSLWSVNIPFADNQVDIDYKYVLCDKNSGEILSWEECENRYQGFGFPTDKGNILVMNDDDYRHTPGWWKAAGMAIPVFSLRSKKGMGIGEFTDLKLAIDFCHVSGMKILQTLPVNDTIANYTFKDSYPYAAISVYALNPLYIHIDAIGDFKSKKDKNRYLKAVKELNSLDEIDLLQVESLKLEFLQILYNEQKDEIFQSKDYQSYFKKNKEWLEQYGAFCFLRDKYGTSNFYQWDTHQEYDKKSINKLLQSESDNIGFYYFCQYFADRQLKEAKSYGRKKDVILKGDLPIGIYRYSCDAWVNPHLYHMDQQAGAPPDDYAVDGQNWEFPTYDWSEMSKDNFSWWQGRMKKLAEYFDALRIDHILGFFRIWQIPMDQISGTLGVFNPRMPFTRQELSDYGLQGDLTRFTEPYIRDHMLSELFGEDKDFVIKQFLNIDSPGIYSLKEHVQKQRQIDEVLQKKQYKNYQYLKNSLMLLPKEVLLMKDTSSKEDAYNPRITLHKTYSYKDLSDREKHMIDSLYNQYFYHRHNEFWKKEALWKLPALLDATDMLICGEDLGMIPATVPEVMKQLNIIPLEIQRMPKGFTAFGQPSNYDYLTVCSPSCHDMSTIRGWWEGNPETRQKFWNQHWHHHGTAPNDAGVAIVERINNEHLQSPSIFAIFPLQDLIGMSGELKRKDPYIEQINDPSNSAQYWRYRFHIDFEDLLEENNLIHKIKVMIKESGR